MAVAFLGVQIAPLAHALGPNDVYVQQRNSDNDGAIITFVPYASGTTALVGLNGTTTRPFTLTLGTGFSINASNTLSVAAPVVAVTDVTGLQASLDSITASLTSLSASLAGKASTSSLAAVATSGSYTDLSNKPSIPAASFCYEGTTQRSSCFGIFKSATVASGVAVFNLTSDGTSGGSALFPNGVIADSVNAFVSDNSASYQMSYAFSNSNKTLTVTANKLTTANILTGILGQAAGNGSVVRLQVWGY